MNATIQGQIKLATLYTKYEFGVTIGTDFNAGLTMDLAGFLFSFEGILILLSYSLTQGIADHSNKLKIEILFHFLGHRPRVFF